MKGDTNATGHIDLALALRAKRRRIPTAMAMLFESGETEAQRNALAPCVPVRTCRLHLYTNFIDDVHPRHMVHRINHRVNAGIYSQPTM